MRDFEEDAILSLLTPKPHKKELEGEGDREEYALYCPNCGEMICNDEDNFCKKCGQPLKVE